MALSPAVLPALLLPLMAAAALLLAACGGAAAIPNPTAKSVEYAQRNGQVTTLPTLKLGRKLYLSRCSSCHNLKAPKFLAPRDWPEMVERMAGNAQLTADQQRAVTQYLVSASAAAYDTSSVANPGAGKAPADTAPAGTPVH